ncbi:hypothetical protein INT43_004289 [Umbelopsis isabellina]|uniref:Uncharacterized protein n=1 Tax=Mortierella isabellina TaxID=91625 RepID=A0A8H7PHZ4_MORIS|nr:hypothetical protein INT43_004289 [Umbelopsis isabellina]
MTLLLTKSCHYAVLVAIEEGRHFPDNPDHDVFIQSRLNLVLPSVVDDLIPPATLINSVPVSTTPNPAWRTTLAYFVSAKLLRRLRKQGAQVRLDISTLSLDSRHEVIGSVSLDVKDAKMVLMKNGKRELREVEAYVVDKGNWLSLSPPSSSKSNLPSPCPEIKAGLFVLDMPQAVSDLAARSSTPVPATFTKRALVKNDPGLELCSSSQIMEHGDTAPSSMASEEDDDYDDDDVDIDEDDVVSPSPSTTLYDNKNKGLPRRVQSHNNIPNIGLRSEYARKRFSSSASHAKVNLEKLSAAFTGMNIDTNEIPVPSQSRRHNRTTSSASFSSVNANTPQNGQSPKLPYRQIGTGTKPITFYFNIVHADHLNSLLRVKSSHIQQQPRPFFRYRFLSNVVIAPASSLSLLNKHSRRSASPKITFFHFRGHARDVQSWLVRQQKLWIDLIVKSDPSDDEEGEIIGLCEIPLTGITMAAADLLQRSPNESDDYFYGTVQQDSIEKVLPERSFPVYDLKTRGLLVSAPKEIARVTVRMGLVAGWWNDEGLTNQPDDRAARVKSHRSSLTRVTQDHVNNLKRQNSNGAEQFEQLLKNKKLKRAISEQGSPVKPSSRQSRFVPPKPLVIPETFSFAKDDDLSTTDDNDVDRYDSLDYDVVPSISNRRLHDQRRKPLEKSLMRGHSDLGPYRETSRRPSTDRNKSIDDILMPPPSSTSSLQRRLNRARTHSSSWTTDVLAPVPSLTADSDTINDDYDESYQESLTQMYSEALDLMRDHSMRWSKVKTLVTSEVDRVLRERQRLAEFRKNVEVMLKTKRAKDHGIAKPTLAGRTRLSDKRLSGQF